MNCSICYEAITTATGKVELSCSHTFHFKCLASWFMKKETCPYCRHEAVDEEKMPSNDDESYQYAAHVSDLELQSPYGAYISEFELERAATRERAAHHIMVIRYTLSKREFENYAATRINALARGFMARSITKIYKVVLTYIKSDIIEIEEAKKSLIKQQARKKIYSIGINISRPAWKNKLAQKIQQQWRNYCYQKSLLAPRACWF